MKPITLGEVSILRIIEIGRSSYPTANMLPESSPDAIARHLPWLKPHFWDDATGDLGSRIGTYVVRTPSTTILIDTGVGNHKTRAHNAAWHMRDGSFLADLAAAGVTAEEVDVVLCTHLHVDHVGWNTRWEDGRWVPTFPNARHVFAGSEWDFWNHETAAGRDQDGNIADSVVPIVDGGLALLVDSDYRVDPWVSFEPSPGHTPGHVCVRVRTSAGEAVFSGDLMHRTVQVAEPQWSSQFCHDGKQAATTRREFVERHADSGVLVLPAHFPHPGYIVRENGGHRFVRAS